MCAYEISRVSETTTFTHSNTLACELKVVTSSVIFITPDWVFAMITRTPPSIVMRTNPSGFASAAHYLNNQSFIWYLQKLVYNQFTSHWQRKDIKEIPFVFTVKMQIFADHIHAFAVYDVQSSGLLIVPSSLSCRLACLVTIFPLLLMDVNSYKNWFYSDAEKVVGCGCFRLRTSWFDHLKRVNAVT